MGEAKQLVMATHRPAFTKALGRFTLRQISLVWCSHKQLSGELQDVQQIGAGSLVVLNLSSLAEDVIWGYASKEIRIKKWFCV